MYWIEAVRPAQSTIQKSVRLAPQEVAALSR